MSLRQLPRIAGKRDRTTLIGRDDIIGTYAVRNIVNGNPAATKQ